MSGVDRRHLIGGAVAATLIAAAPPPRAIECKAGRFAGTVEGGVHVYRGIRYGRAQRFRAPVAAARTDTRADRFGPIAPQPGLQDQPQSEDCLFLNIWTPAADGRARKPVMVYIHGGAYSNGTSTSPLNDGRRLAAAGDVVVVTVNHRLNAFGYLYLARIDPRFADSGNAGQLDLILALQWVRDNIAAFGGDPGNVLVFGQSGGGAKIATLMGTPAAGGLFHRAITMSGQQVTASGPLNATTRTRAYLAKLGDPGIDALLTIPVANLVEALGATDPILGGGVYFGPVLDMKWLMRHPFWPDANPQSNRVPMMLGNTHDETRAFIAPDSARMTGLTWDNLAERMAPELRIDVLPEWVVGQYRAHYPAWSPREVLWGATTAARSWRGQVIEAEARARADAPTWVYQVDFASPTEPERGAPHTMDIALAFGTLDAAGSYTGTGPSAQAASSAVQDAFVTFARTGTAAWPEYRLDRRTTMLFDTASRAVDDPRRWERELFARIPYIQPGDVMRIDRRTALAGALASGAALAQLPDPLEEIVLWPDGAPGMPAVPPAEKINERSTDPLLRDRAMLGITRPRMTVFRPANPNGAAVVIAPGGGYRWVVMDKEGYELGRWLSARGFTVFVLFYRLPGDGWAAGPDVALSDAQRAVRLVRARARDFAIDPARVAFMGFSAGGHLCADLVARWHAETYRRVDAADALPARPLIAAPIYPVVSMTAPLAHPGSRELLVGKDTARAVEEAHSPHLHIRADAPPCFLTAAEDDPVVPVENTLLLRAALKAAKVPVETHLFETGGHGFGIRRVVGQPAAIWPELFVTWAKTRGLA